MPQSRQKRLSATWAVRSFFALLTMILLLIAGVVLYPWFSTTMTQLEQASLDHESSEIRITVDTFIDHRLQVLKDYARLPQVNRALSRSTESQQILNHLLDNLPLLGSECQLVLLGAGGEVIHASHDYPLFSYAEQDWFKSLLAGQADQKVGISRADATAFWRFAVPVTAPDNQHGILVAELPIRALGEERPLFNGLESGQLDILFQGQRVGRFGYSASSNMVSYDLPDTDISLQFYSDRFNLESSVQRLLLIFVISLIGVTLLLMIMAHRFNWNYFVKPIDQLRGYTRQLAEGAVGEKIPENQPLLEIALLAEDFNAMAHQIDQREQALVESRDTLEQRVMERTAELHESKLALQKAYQSLEQLVEKRTRKMQKMQGQMLIQEKMASIGQLAAGLAHELNNPLNFVHTNFSTLRQNVGDFISLLMDYRQLLEQIPVSGDNAIEVQRLREREENLQLGFLLSDMQQLFRETSEGFKRIDGIVQSMRNFSRVDHAGDFADYDLNKGIEDTLTIARNEYKYSALVKTDLQQLPPLPCVPQQINQVLLNLIVNAAQAITSQQRSSPGAIRISTRQEDNIICLEVCDDGPGIPEKIRHRIFEPFFTTKEAGKGTGLGLSICYDIVVHKHGGTLILNQAEPGNTCFLVQIPLSGTIS